MSHFCPNLRTASQLTENKSHILARSPRPLPLDSWPPLMAPDTLLLLLLPRLPDPCPRPVSAPSAWKVPPDHLRPGSLSHFTSLLKWDLLSEAFPASLIFNYPSALPDPLYVPILPVTSSLCILHLSIMSIVYLHPEVGRGSLFCSPPSPQHLKQGLAQSRYLTKTFTEWMREKVNREMVLTHVAFLSLWSLWTLVAQGPRDTCGHTRIAQLFFPPRYQEPGPSGPQP